MAIDYTGISSLDTGAHDITYSGNEGPRSPEENREIASAILGDEMGEVASQLWNGMSPPEKSEWRSIEGFIQSEDFKIILMKLQSEQQDRGGIQTASAADPMLQEEYDKYVFEMDEMGQQPMPFEQFREQAVAGMATGGRVGFFKGALADTKEGKAMSPGTSADYSPGQGHRETREAKGPPGGGDQKMKYTAPPRVYDRSKDTGPDRFKLAEANRIKKELESIDYKDIIPDKKAINKMLMSKRNFMYPGRDTINYPWNEDDVSGLAGIDFSNLIGTTPVTDYNTHLAKVYNKADLEGIDADWAGYGFGASDKLEAMQNLYEGTKKLMSNPTQTLNFNTPKELREKVGSLGDIPFSGYKSVDMDLVPKDFLETKEDIEKQISPYKLFGKADGGIARLGYDLGGRADIGFSRVQPSIDGSRPGYFAAQRREEAKEKGQEFGGYSDRERGERQAQRTAVLQASPVPRGKETISPGTGVITRPDGTVDTGGGYIHRPTGITYDKEYIDKFINVGDEDEKTRAKLLKKKRKLEASQRRKRTRTEKEQRKELITLINRRKKQDPDWKGDLPEGWEDDVEYDAWGKPISGGATLDELYGWAKTRDWTGKEKYSDLEGRELNEFWEKHGYVPTSKDWPGLLGKVYPEKPVTFDEIEQAFQKGKGSLWNKGADEYRVWSPDPDSKEADWLQEMAAFHPKQYAIQTGQDWNPITGGFTKRQDDGYGGVPDAVPHGDIPEWQRQGFPSYEAWLAAQGTGTTAATTTSPIATGPITGQLGGINTAHHPILANIYGVPEADFLNQYPMFAADGGRAGYAGGGIADLRQGYFLGKLVQSITKPFKGITRGIKKFAKSPAGKMAIMAALGFGVPGTGFKGMFGKGGTGMFGGGQGLAGLRQSLIGSAATGAKAIPGQGALFKPGTTGWLGKMFLKPDATSWSMANISPMKSILMSMGIGGLYTGMTQKDDENDMWKKYLADLAAEDAYWDPRFDESNFRRIASADGGRIGYQDGKTVIEKGPLYIDPDTDIPLHRIEKRFQEMNRDERIEEYFEMLKRIEKYKDLDELDMKGRRFEDFLHWGAQGAGGSGWPAMTEALEYTDHPAAEKYYEKGEHYNQGGRIGYDEGKKVLPHRKAALAAMYRNGAQEGGLMDLGGMEKDYRNDGGFVPIGGQERADDVPARLSKNEFVFTADAVRAAGGGDIDRGAEVMENVMENLEQGGQVSEESQGLEGARNMFATAQRLEGVL